MVQIKEGTFNVDGQSLYTRTWLPDGPAKAKLVLVHGFSDHCNMYNDLGNALARAGIAVYSFDQRGWGRSVKRPADRGKTGPTSVVLSDLAAFIEAQLDDKDDGLPVFVLGHSMGGGEVLTLASEQAHEDKVVRRVRGWLLEAPLIGWPEGQAPGWLKVKLGRLAGRFLPHRQLGHALPPADLTRNQDVVARVAADDLCHDLGTLEGLASLLDRTDDLSAGRRRLCPSVRSLWLGHGTDDRVCGFGPAKKWFDAQTAVPDKEFRTYDGWFHQLHSEPEREQYFQHLVDWIMQRATAAEEEDKPNSKL